MTKLPLTVCPPGSVNNNMPSKRAFGSKPGLPARNDAMAVFTWVLTISRRGDRATSTQGISELSRNRSSRGSNTYTHLSAMWVADAERWVLLYSLANDESGVAGEHLPVVARIGTSLWTWSDEIEIFNPNTQGAYGRYMHEVGVDRIHPDIPPTQNPFLPEHDGWAYGAFLLTHYTQWNPDARELTIFYLMSLSSPYHVQLMRSRFIVP